MFQPLLLEALSALFAANKEFGSYALNKYIQGEMLSSTTSAPVKAPNMKLLALVWDAVPDNKGTEVWCCPIGKRVRRKGAGEGSRRGRKQRQRKESEDREGLNPCEQQIMFCLRFYVS